MRGISNLKSFINSGYARVKNSPRGMKVTTIALAFAIIGGVMLIRANALSPYFSVEPESGSVSAPAKIAEDTSASGGRYILFGDSTLPPNPEISGTTYYVDCNNGSDSNDGKSQAGAWKTLAKASQVSLSAGDGIKLKNGCVFNNDPLTLNSNGSATANIIVDSYDGTATNMPVIQRNSNGADISIGGSYITVQNVHVKGIAPSTISSSDATCPGSPVGNIQGVRLESGAHHNTVQKILATGLYAGVYAKGPSGSTAAANNNQIIYNNFQDNIMMSPLDTSGGNDAGAFAVLLWGDDNTIAYNQMSGSDACSYDYGRDGSAVEIYGGQRNKIHHNKASQNDAFVELGNSRSVDNEFYYNQFVSNLNTSIFLVTRGASSSYGPINGTKMYNNVAYLTGSNSQGVVCHAGCSASILTMKNNILWANWKSLYADAAFNESNNIYWKDGGSPLVQATISSTSKKVDPMFVNAGGGDLHLKTGSVAINNGDNSIVPAGTRDLDNLQVPAGGTVDIGAYEAGAVASRNQLIASITNSLRNWLSNAVELFGSISGRITNIFSSSRASAAETSFVFAVTGDNGSSSNAANVFKGIGASTPKPNFVVHVGDFRYGQLTDANWCQFVKDNLNIGAGYARGATFGETLPVQLVAGNHEDGLTHPSDGLVDNVAQCLPNRLSATLSPHGGTSVSGYSPLGTTIPSITGSGTYVTNNYSKSYYFDYPVGAPIARFVFASPKMPYKYGGYYDYSKGSVHYQWLSDAIDSARASGIKWVIAVNHETYVSVGAKGDEVGSDFYNLLISKKVDLLLHGHEHNYQRSKQIAYSSGCSTLTTSSANTACVVNSPSNSQFNKGAGSIIVINGAGGIGHYSVSTSDSHYPYYATADSSSYGYSHIVVTDSSLTANYVSTYGSYSDSFTIGSSSTPVDTTPPTVAITSPSNGQSVSGAVNITATSSDNVGVSRVDFLVNNAVVSSDTSSPYSYSWASTSVANGNHTIVAKSYDTSGNVGTSATVTVNVNNGCTPLSTTYGGVTFNVNVPSTGTYRVWTRMKAADATNNSYAFQVADACNYAIGDSNSIASDGWTWVDYKNGSTNDKATVQLSAGTHQVQIAGRESGVQVDKILFLSDSCIPTGMGDNCTSNPDTTPPTISITAPTNGATISGSQTVTVNVSDTGGSGVSKVEYYVDNGLVATNTLSPYSFVWNTSGLSVGQHVLKAKAFDGAGNSTESSAVTITIADTTPPTVNITSPQSGSAVTGTVNINYTTYDNVGVTQVDLYIDNVKKSSTTNISQNAVYSWDSTTVANGSHSVRLTALDGAGNSGGSQEITLNVANDKTPPTAPTNLTASASSSTQVNLAWGASTDDIAVQKYLVERNGSVVAEVSATTASTYSYADRTVVASTAYTYRVYAVDTSARVSGASNSAAVTTPAAPDTTLPSAPSNLTGTAQSGTQINLSWGASTDTGGSGLAGYYVYRNGTRIASVASNVTTYGDSTVSEATTYNYYVKAFDGAGNQSANSNTISVTTPQPTINVVTFFPVDDAMITGNKSSKNYGSSSSITVDNKPATDMLLKFQVSGVGTRRVLSAKLRLYAIDGRRSSGGSYHRTANSSWTEETVTWDNAPAADLDSIATTGSVSRNTWLDIDVSALIKGDGIYSIRASSGSNDGSSYRSKEAGNSYSPRIILTLGN